MSLSRQRLSRQQKGIVKQHAGDVIKSLWVSTPPWSTLGDDIREQLRKQLIEVLDNTQNTGLAVILKKDSDLARTCLKEKVKSMRWHESESGKRQKNSREPQQQSPDAAALDNQNAVPPLRPNRSGN